MGRVRPRYRYHIELLVENLHFLTGPRRERYQDDGSAKETVEISCKSFYVLLYLAINSRRSRVLVTVYEDISSNELFKRANVNSCLF